MKRVAAFLLCTLSALAHGQWQRTETTDTFANIPLIIFTLQGKFLTHPSSGHPDAPVWTTVCTPKQTHNGKDLYDGLLEKSSIDFGTVLHSATLSQVAVSYRLDDAKAKVELWPGGTSGTEHGPVRPLPTPQGEQQSSTQEAGDYGS